MKSGYIIVADSGSTKADWVAIDSDYNRVFETSTMGFNPFFHDKDVVQKGLSENDMLSKIAADVMEVYFYGAGCSAEDLNRKIEDGLGLVFENAKIKVDHDLTAAAYATADDQPCIACILGTGSNSCYFDGEMIIDKIPALGYILGDEGSGSYYGKQVLRAYLYNKLPRRIHDKLHDTYKLTKATIFENVYMKPNANVYLASFAKLLSDNRNDVWVEELVSHGMLDFLSYHVCSFENYRDVPVHFVGSIAFFFEDVLRAVAERRSVTVGKIMKQPVEGLVDYHLRQAKLSHS
ncbi:MAG: hypothetical protein HKN92_01125 [Chitinophagales bacterium]|nr:hypothetical protein [Chitinophagales bacterium]